MGLCGAPSLAGPCSTGTKSAAPVASAPGLQGSPRPRSQRTAKQYCEHEALESARGLSICGSRMVCCAVLLLHLYRASPWRWSSSGGCERIITLLAPSSVVTFAQAQHCRHAIQWPEALLTQLHSPAEVWGQAADQLFLLDDTDRGAVQLRHPPADRQG